MSRLVSVVMAVMATVPCLPADGLMACIFSGCCERPVLSKFGSLFLAGIFVIGHCIAFMGGNLLHGPNMMSGTYVQKTKFLFCSLLSWSSHAADMQNKSKRDLIETEYNTG